MYNIMSRKFSGNKPPSKSRGVPVNVFGDDDDDALESFGSQTASAGPSTSTFDFVLSSKPQSKKERQRAAEVAAAAAAAAAAEAKKSQRMLVCPNCLYRPQLPPPPPPQPPAMTCEICNRPKSKGELFWKESPMGFGKKGLCPDCNIDPQSPKLVWAPQPDMLSQWHAQTLEALTRAGNLTRIGNLTDRLKKEVHLSTRLHHPLTPKQRMVSLRGAHDYLSSAFLLPPAGAGGVRPYSRLLTDKFKDEINSRMNKQPQQRKRGGTRRKSKSRF
jgi:hypothetical protein